MKVALKTSVIVVFLVSSMILISWIAKWSLPLTFIPHSPPMVFNTTLSFMLLSLGFLAPETAIGRRAGVLVLTLTFLIGLQYLMNVSFGIDELFVPGALSDRLSAPGRMTPPAVFVMIFASISQLSLRMATPQRIFPWGLLALLSSSLVLFIGLTGVLYDLLPVFMSTRVAILTAICSVLMGLHGVLLSREHLSYQERSPWKSAGLILALALFIWTFFHWRTLVIENSKQINEALRSQISSRSERLSRDFEEMGFSFRKLTASPPSSGPSTQMIAERFPGALALIHLSPRPEVDWRSRNEAPSTSAKELRVLKEQLQEDSRFHFYQSLTFQKHRWMAFSQAGYLLLFSPEILIHQTFPTDRYRYTLTATGQILFSNSAYQSPDSLSWIFSQDLNLWDSRLNLSLSPKTPTLIELGLSNHLPFLIAGLLLSVAVGVLFHFIPTLRKGFSH